MEKYYFLKDEVGPVRHKSELTKGRKMWLGSEAQNCPKISSSHRNNCFIAFYQCSIDTYRT